MFKLTHLAKKIHFSGLLHETLKHTCKTKGCPEKIIRRPVQMQWNLTTWMIGNALDINSALHTLTNTPSNDLVKWALKESEWKALKDLYGVLEVSGLCAHPPSNDLTTRLYF